MEKLDEKDRAICIALEKDARASVSEVARKTGLPRDSVHYRIQRLIKQGYVHTFEMILDHKKLGYPIYAYVNFELHNLSEEDEKLFHGYLMENDYIGHISKVTGRYDYMIAIVARELSKLGINIEEKEDGMILHPSSNLKGAALNSENDHRLFMAFSIAGMYVGECTVSDPESVKVSYPNFIEDVGSIGAKISVQ